MEKDSIIESAKFANYLASMTQKPFYVVIGIAGDTIESKLSWSGWPGAKDPTSLAPYIANCKAGELIWLSQEVGLSKTPIPDFEKGCGWKGGVRYGDHYVAVSGLSQEHDQLVAAILLYNLLHQSLQLHHVGFECNSDQYQHILKQENGYIKNATDHKRIYFAENDPTFGKSYAEYFCYPNQPQNSIHFDFVVENMEKFLKFLSKVIEAKSEFWPDSEKNSPKAGIYIEDSKGFTMGVMCREEFWNLEDD